MIQDNRAPLEISDPQFQANLTSIYNKEGIEGLSTWVTNEISEGRKVKMPISQRNSEEKVVFDRCINALKDGKPAGNILPFLHEVNAENSALAGVYAIEGEKGDVQLIIRTYHS
jgi:hypothetical protein